MSRHKKRPKIEDFLSDLNSQDWETRYNGVRGLGYLGKPAAVEFLLPLLEDSHNSVRWQTIYSLGLLKDKRAVEPLLSLLQMRLRGYGAMQQKLLVELAVPVYLRH